MIIRPKTYCVKGTNFVIRSAVQKDAKNLSDVRLQIDGETQNMDRERGEAFIDRQNFENLIHHDTENDHNLFLVAVIQDHIVGFSRCEGSELKRLAHKVEFGICVLKKYWGLGIGTNLLREALHWADANRIKKIALSVLETNDHAIKLYNKFDFKIEGILKNDKLLSDGKFYHTILMGRFHE
ncbi:MAG: N-acetyltransferase family protein [Sporolactobacillus sp.]